MKGEPGVYSFVQPDTSFVFPCTRAQFYAHIDKFTGYLDGSSFWFRTIGATKIYSISSMDESYTVEVLNDWSKVKSLELAIFGSFGNGGDLGATSTVGSGTFMSVIPNFKRFELGLLRWALVKFPNYDTCYPEEMYLPSPTALQVNPSARTINWNNAPGFPNVSDYEVSVNEGEWVRTTGKPFTIPTLGYVPVGQLMLRTRTSPGSYLSASEVLLNEMAYPDVPITLSLDVSAADSLDALKLTISALSPLQIDGSTLDIAVTLSVNFSTMDAQVVQFDTSNSLEEFFFYLGGIPSEYGIDNAFCVQSEVDGRSINLIY